MNRYAPLLLLLAACYSSAVAAQDGPLTNDTVKELRERSDRGDVNAQFELGSMYYGGEGVAQNSAESMKWFRRAAEQGDM